MVRNANRGFPEVIVSKEYQRTPGSVCLTAFARARYLEQRRCGNGVRVTVHSPLVKSNICDLMPPGLLDRSSIQIHRLSPTLAHSLKVRQERPRRGRRKGQLSWPWAHLLLGWPLRHLRQAFSQCWLGRGAQSQNINKSDPESNFSWERQSPAGFSVLPSGSSPQGKIRVLQARQALRVWNLCPCQKTL